MKRILLVLVFLALTACSTAASGGGMTSSMNIKLPSGSLPDLGPAPELKNRTWLNTDGPVHLADLRGKVVGVEMWTFDCINCQHVMPHLKDWYARYKDQGFVLIGNHFPEFSYEADLTNLKKAVADDGILYPVAQDNDGETWDSYNNSYWPSLYLIDKRGRIRYVHIGEGAYDEIEGNIKSLLAEAYP
jgi:thiol-disulfide isomerase/thioredoxin